MSIPAPQFLDYLDLENLTSYDSPAKEADDDSTLLLDPFSSYMSKQDTCELPGSVDMQYMLPRSGLWGGFSGHLDPDTLATAGAAEDFFVDPELCSPGAGSENIEVQVQVAPVEPPTPCTQAPNTGSPLHKFSNVDNSSTGVAAPEQGPARKRRVRKSKRGSDAAEDNLRRSKFLERNRIAASKCREKKKQYVSELEEKAIEFESLNRQMHVEASRLEATVSSLKHDLMTHAKCNDPNIDCWLQKEASKFAKSEGELSRRSLRYGQAVVPDISTGSERSRNPSNASSYMSLPNLSFETPGGLDERRNSIAFSHASGSLYPSPTEASFPGLSPQFKRDPDAGYNPVADPMFAADLSNLGAD